MLLVLVEIVVEVPDLEQAKVLGGQSLVLVLNHTESEDSTCDGMF